MQRKAMKSGRPRPAVCPPMGVPWICSWAPAWLRPAQSRSAARLPAAKMQHSDRYATYCMLSSIGFRWRFQATVLALPLAETARHHGSSITHPAGGCACRCALLGGPVPTAHKRNVCRQRTWSVSGKVHRYVLPDPTTYSTRCARSFSMEIETKIDAICLSVLLLTAVLIARSLKTGEPAQIFLWDLLKQHAASMAAVEEAGHALEKQLNSAAAVLRVVHAAQGLSLPDSSAQADGGPPQLTRAQLMEWQAAIWCLAEADLGDAVTASDALVYLCRRDESAPVPVLLHVAAHAASVHVRPVIVKALVDLAREAEGMSALQAHPDALYDLAQRAGAEQLIGCVIDSWLSAARLRIAAHDYQVHWSMTCFEGSEPVHVGRRLTRTLGH